MKRLAIVGLNLLPGGAEVVMQQLISFFCESNIECRLFLVSDKPVFYDIDPRCPVEILRHQSKCKVIDKIAKYHRLRQLLCSYRPDVILSMPEDVGIYVILAMFGTKIPVVVSERNDPWLMPYKKVTRILRRLMYPFAAGLIFQTEKAASFFTRRQQAKGIVLPNPLDLSRLPKPYKGVRDKIIVSAGRLEKQKNFPLLIEAFTIFYKTHPDYRLIIYGEGVLRQELEVYAKSVLPENVFLFPGYVQDVTHKMNRCAVFALSSDYEGVPNILIEAMAMGIPSVSTDCSPGGAASLIINKENGMITPVGDAVTLANTISYIVDKPIEASIMAENAIQIQNCLNIEKVAQRWFSYLDMCGRT